MEEEKLGIKGVFQAQFKADSFSVLSTGMYRLVGVFVDWVGGESESQCDLGRSNIFFFSLSLLQP